MKKHSPFYYQKKKLILIGKEMKQYQFTAIPLDSETTWACFNITLNDFHTIKAEIKEKYVKGSLRVCSTNGPRAAQYKAELEMQLVLLGISHISWDKPNS